MCSGVIPSLGSTETPQISARTRGWCDWSWWKAVAVCLLAGSAALLQPMLFWLCEGIIPGVCSALSVADLRGQVLSCWRLAVEDLCR